MSKLSDQLVQANSDNKGSSLIQGYLWPQIEPRHKHEWERTRQRCKDIPSTEELIIQLEESLGISTLEYGPKLIGAIIANKIPNCGVIKSILRAAWKEFVEIKIAWGVLLNLCSEQNAIRICEKIGELVEYETLNQAWGFIHVRVQINTRNPLPLGFWLLRLHGSKSLAEFQYEHLSEFCYNCGRLGYCNTYYTLEKQ